MTWEGGNTTRAAEADSRDPVRARVLGLPGRGWESPHTHCMTEVVVQCLTGIGLGEHGEKGHVTHHTCVLAGTVSSKTVSTTKTHRRGSEVEDKQETHGVSLSGQGGHEPQLHRGPQICLS